MSSRIVLFGGEGFVGSNLQKYFTVPVTAPPLAEVDFTRPETLRGVLQAGDIVVNAAGYANATDRTAKGQALFRSVNVDGVRHLAEAAVAAGAAQLVHISSVAAMGRWHRDDVTEAMMTPVKTPYAQSKLDGELVLQPFMDQLPITMIRPTSVFGEGRGLGRTLCKLASRGTVPLPGGGTAHIPFTYIGNLARGVELTLGNPACYGQTFILGDERSYPLREIVTMLAHALGHEARIISIPTPLAYVAACGLEWLAGLRGTAPLLDRGRLETMTCSVSYSIQALQQATGYRPPYALPEALQRIAAWYKGEQAAQPMETQ